MTVGEFARRAGLRASAVRYYERLGLLPPPPRRNGRRVYGPEAFAHLAVVRVGRECGFTLEETRRLLRGFSPKTAASARWRALAESKLLISSGTKRHSWTSTSSWLIWKCRSTSKYSIVTAWQWLWLWMTSVVTLMVSPCLRV